MYFTLSCFIVWVAQTFNWLHMHRTTHTMELPMVVYGQVPCYKARHGRFQSLVWWFGICAWQHNRDDLNLQRNWELVIMECGVILVTTIWVNLQRALGCLGEGKIWRWYLLVPQKYSITWEVLDWCPVLGNLERFYISQLMYGQVASIFFNFKEEFKNFINQGLPILVHTLHLYGHFKCGLYTCCK